MLLLSAVKIHVENTSYLWHFQWQLIRTNINNTTQIAIFTHGADENFHKTKELTDIMFTISTTLGNYFLCSVKGLM